LLNLLLRNKVREFLNPPATLFNLWPRCRKKSGEVRKQAGKKKKGCGENAFLPACQSGGRQTMEWERFRTSSRKRKAKQKKFVFLIEKNFWGQVIKKM